MFKLFSLLGSKNSFSSKTNNLPLSASLEISICKIKQLILHTQDKLNIFYTLSLTSVSNYRENNLVYVGRSAVAVSLQ